MIRVTIQIAAAVATLVRELPAQRDHVLKLLRTNRDSRDDTVYFSGSAWGRFLRCEYKALTTLLAAIEEIQDYPGFALVPVSEVINPAERWDHFAPALAKAFTEAMRTTNSGWKFGLSANSPGPRFIAAVMPWITGDTPSEDTIAQFFKRRRRRGTQAKADVPRTKDGIVVPNCDVAP